MTGSKYTSPNFRSIIQGYKMLDKGGAYQLSSRMSPNAIAAVSNIHLEQIIPRIIDRSAWHMKCSSPGQGLGASQKAFRHPPIDSCAIGGLPCGTGIFL